MVVLVGSVTSGLQDLVSEVWCFMQRMTQRYARHREVRKNHRGRDWATLGLRNKGNSIKIPILKR
jgi:hypothetical protein